MKKIISAILSFALCIPLAACGTGGTGGGTGGEGGSGHTHHWTWTGDETHHWKICDGCDETIDRGVHIDANADSMCDDCEREISIKQDDPVEDPPQKDPQEDPGHEHDYTWHFDDSEHWLECTCGDTKDRGPHSFGTDYTCACGAVTDAPAQSGQDTKSYYLVGAFGGLMNWETVREEKWRFNRLKDVDDQGLTVYVKEMDFYDTYKFKVVNDAATDDFYQGSFGFSAVRGGSGAQNFVDSNGHGSILISNGHEGTYKLTLHTNPTDATAGYLDIDYVRPLAEQPEPPHEHSFSLGWTSDAAYHWHAALCGHSVTSGREQHTFLDGVCTVCGYGNPPKEDPPIGGGDGGGGGDVGGETGDFEFGDSVSYQNDAFYKDYSAEDKELYYTLWKETTSISLQVDITPTELNYLNDQTGGSDEVRNTYRKCNLTITVNGKDYYYEEVGIRMRGNTSRKTFCNPDGTIYYLTHFRFSLSETFDGEEYAAGKWGDDNYHDWTNDPAGRAERKDRSFATMEKFYYKWNKNYDQTYIREIYANRMFQAYGILAPHITLTQFCVKQASGMESLGVGNFYETVDKAFIKRNFDKENKGGDLYKCAYTANGPANLTSMQGVGEYDGATYELKTNTDPLEFNNHKYLQAFISMLNSNQNTFTQQLESMIDMDYFTRFEAVNYLAGNPDCIRNNANNYYLYFTPAGKAYIIPYDYDRCFGINTDWNPSHSGMTDTNPYSSETPNGGCSNPLYTKTIFYGGIKKYQTMYKDWLQKILDGKWFTYENFKPIYDSYKNTYNSLTTPSRNVHLNLDTSRFYFSEEGTNNFGSTENISMKDYIEAKRRTLLNLINGI